MATAGRALWRARAVRGWWGGRRLLCTWRVVGAGGVVRTLIDGAGARRASIGRIACWLRSGRIASKFVPAEVGG